MNKSDHRSELKMKPEMARLSPSKPDRLLPNLREAASIWICLCFFDKSQFGFVIDFICKEKYAKTKKGNVLPEGKKRRKQLIP